MDLLSEGLIPLSQARLLLPARGGSHPDRKTLRGWIKAGRLEAVRVGGVWYTTEPAVGRFVAKGAEKVVPVRSPAARRRASEKAKRELIEAGW